MGQPETLSSSAALASENVDCRTGLSASASKIARLVVGEWRPCKTVVPPFYHNGTLCCLQSRPYCAVEGARIEESGGQPDETRL